MLATKVTVALALLCILSSVDAAHRRFQKRKIGEWHTNTTTMSESLEDTLSLTFTETREVGTPTESLSETISREIAAFDLAFDAASNTLTTIPQGGTFATPYIINVVTSAGRKQTNINGLMITPSVSSGTISLSPVATVNGQATFNGFKFLTNPVPFPGPGVKITFTAGTGLPLLPVNGKSITTAQPVAVQATSCADIRFSPTGSYFTAAGVAASMETLSGVIVVVEAIDGAGVMDPTCSNVNIIPTANSGTFSVTSVTMSQGIANFSNFYFLSNPSAATPITFTASGSSPSLNTKTVVTGLITVTPYENNKDLRFRSDFNTFTASDQSGTVVYGQAISPLVVILVDSRGAADTTGNNVVITVTSNYNNVTLFNTTANVIKGVATFNGLMIMTHVDPAALAQNPLRLTFTAGNQVPAYSVSGKSIKTGNIIVTPKALSKLGFATGSVLKTGQTTATKALLSTSIGIVKVAVQDSAGNTDPSGTGDITCTADKGALSGATATISNGIATFNNLMFVSISSSDNILTFKYGSLTLNSFTVSVLTGTVGNFNFRFRSANSFFTLEGQARTVSYNTAMPNIVIEMIDSDGNVDTSNSEVTITASSALSLLSGGDKIKMVNGVATFSSLAFTSHPIPGPLTFTAGDEGNQPCQNKAIVTGLVTVQILTAFSVRFSATSSLFTAPLGPMVSALMNVSMNDIQLQLLNSDSTLDTTSTDVYVIASSNNGTLLNTNQSFQNGVAIFSTLRPLNATLQNLTFTVFSSRNVNVNNTNLTSGVVNVTDGLEKCYKILFDSLSPLQVNAKFESAQFDTALPTFRVVLVDSREVPEVTNNEVMIAATTNDGTMSGVNVTMVKGVATFSALKFTSHPKNARLTFTAYTATTCAVQGKTLVTGLITVSALRNYRMRFVNNSDSKFKFEGDTGAVESNIAFTPSVTIEVLTSENITDTSSTELVTIVATTSAGKLLNNEANVTAGNAQFTALTFLDEPSLPKLTFTAKQFSGTPGLVNTTKLVTGQITVTFGDVAAFKIGWNNPTTNQLITGPASVYYDTPVSGASILIQNSSGRTDINAPNVELTITANNGTLSGNETIRFMNGVATFSNLRFMSHPTNPIQLTFTCGSQPETKAAGKQLVSAPFKVNVVRAYTFSFDTNKTTSLFNAEGQSEMVSLGLPFPRAIRIFFYNSLNEFDATIGSEFYIQVTTDQGTLDPAGTIYYASNGTVVLDKLMYTEQNNPLAMPVMNFTLFCTNSAIVSPSIGRSLQSGGTVINTAARDNWDFRFQAFASTFVSTTQLVTVTYGQSFPVVLWMLDSRGGQDVSNSKIVFVASSDCSCLNGSVAQLNFGIARFSLTFTKHVPPQRITFLANHTSDGSPANALGKTLLTSWVKVIPQNMSSLNISNTTIQFTNMTQYVPVPKIQVFVLQSDGSIDLGVTSDKKVTVTATMSNGGVLSNNVATVNKGIAVFDQLTVSTVPTSGSTATLTFSFTDFKGTVQKVVTDRAYTIIPCIYSYGVRFKNSPTSFFQTAGQPATVNFSQPIPEIRLEIEDSIGRFDTALGLEIRVRASAGANVQVLNELSLFRGGIAVFPDLTILSHVSPMKLTFTVYEDLVQNIPVVGKSIVTGNIQISPLPNYAMVFTNTSAITRYMYARKTTFPYSFSIQLTRSDGVYDTSDNSLYISCANTGQQQQVVRGKATFTGLYFMYVIEPTPLTFVAGNSSLYVSQKQLVTPKVITVIGSNFGLRVRSQPQQILFDDKTNFTVEVVNSLGLFDASSSTIKIDARGPFLANPQTVTVKKGVATFQDLVFFDASKKVSNVDITFIAQEEMEGNLTTFFSNKNVTTPLIPFKPYPQYALAFMAPLKTRYLLNDTIPPISLVVTDSHGNYDLQAGNVTVIMTDGNGLFPPVTGTVVKGVVTFSGVVYLSVVPETILRFQSFAPQYPRLHGTSILSTPFRVTARPAYNMMFGQCLNTTVPIFTQEYQTANVQQYVPIVVSIQLIDSEGGKDQETNDIVITAMSSKGTLAGSRAVSQNGCATFFSLMFKDFPTSDNLFLNFTAGTQGGYPVGNRVIRTGLLSLSEMNTFSFAIRFSEATDAFHATTTTPQYVKLGKNFSLPFVIEMITNYGSFDNSNSDTIITAWCNKCKLEGDTAQMNNGVATFPDLKFISLPGDESNGYSTVLNFTAGSEGNYSVQGKTIRSNIIFVTPATAAFLAFEAAPAKVQEQNKPIRPPFNIQVMNEAGLVDRSAGGEVRCEVTNGASLTITSAAVVRGVAYMNQTRFSTMSNATNISCTYWIDGFKRATKPAAANYDIQVTAEIYANTFIDHCNDDNYTYPIMVEQGVPFSLCLSLYDSALIPDATLPSLGFELLTTDDVAIEYDISQATLINGRREFNVRFTTLSFRPATIIVKAAQSPFVASSHLNYLTGILITPRSYDGVRVMNPPTMAYPGTAWVKPKIAALDSAGGIQYFPENTTVEIAFDTQRITTTVNSSGLALFENIMLSASKEQNLTVVVTANIPDKPSINTYFMVWYKPQVDIAEMKFVEGFLTASFWQGAVVGVALPRFVIGIFDSQGKPTKSKGSVSAIIQGGTLAGSVIAVVDGKAVFPALTIQAATSITDARIRFSFLGFILYSGPIRILYTTVPLYSLYTESSVTVMHGSAIPTISVRVLDSSGNVDETAQNVKLDISLYPGGTIDGVTQTTTDAGTAVFRNLTAGSDFLPQDNPYFVIRIVSGAGTQVVANNPIMVTINVVPKPNSRVAFSTRASWCSAPGQPLIVHSPKTPLYNFDAFILNSFGAPEYFTVVNGVTVNGPVRSDILRYPVALGRAVITGLMYTGKTGEGVSLSFGSSLQVSSGVVEDELTASYPNLMVIPESYQTWFRAVPGSAIQTIRVVAAGQLGGLVYSSDSLVYASVSSPWQLSGTLTAKFEKGVATFSNLIITGCGKAIRDCLSAPKAFINFNFTDPVTSVSGRVSHGPFVVNIPPPESNPAFPAVRLKIDPIGNVAFCADVPVSAAESTVSSFQWSATVTTTPDAQSIVGYVASQRTVKFTLPLSKYLTKGASGTIQICLQSGDTKTCETMTLTNPSPAIQIPSTINLPTSESLTIQPNISVALCTSLEPESLNVPIYYRWSHNSSTNATKRLEYWTPQALTQTKLVIPPNTFPAGYTGVSISVCYGTACSFQMVVLNVSAPPLQAVILKGSRTIAANAKLTLDATGSSDDYFMTKGVIPPLYYWRCQPLGTVGCPKIEDPSAPRIILGPLNPGVYQFILEYTVADRISRTTAAITVSDKAEVFLNVLSNIKDNMFANTAQTISIWGELSTPDSTALWEWTATPEIPDVILENSRFLTIPAFLLPPLTTYDVKVTVTTNGGTASGNLQFRTVPKYLNAEGKCYVTPNLGISMNTTFAIICSNFGTTAGITYEYFALIDDARRALSVGPIALSSQTFKLGVAKPGDVSFAVVVRDVNQNEIVYQDSNFTATMDVNPEPPTATAASAAAKEALAKGDVAQAFSVVQNVVDVTMHNNDTKELTSAVKAMSEVIRSAVRTPAEVSTGLATTCGVAKSSNRLPPAAQETVASDLQFVISRAAQTTGMSISQDQFACAAKGADALLSSGDATGADAKSRNTVSTAMLSMSNDLLNVMSTNLHPGDAVFVPGSQLSLFAAKMDEPHAGDGFRSGKASITFPTGLPSPTGDSVTYDVRIASWASNPYPSPPVTVAAINGGVLDINIKDIDRGSAVTDVSSNPCTIVIPVSDASASGTSMIGVYWSEENQDWSSDGISVVSKNSTATVLKVAHFTAFSTAVLKPKEAKEPTISVLFIVWLCLACVFVLGFVVSAVMLVIYYRRRRQEYKVREEEFYKTNNRTQQFMAIVATQNEQRYNPMNEDNLRDMDNDDDDDDQTTRNETTNATHTYAGDDDEEEEEDEEGTEDETGSDDLSHSRAQTNTNADYDDF
eukprot:PhF_6_TR15927/c0_g1_i1/m.24699